MKTSYLFLAIVFFCSTIATAQTATIAIKSHSGKLMHPVIPQTDNFGLVPMPEIVEIEWLSDTSYYQLRKLGNEEYHDTIYRYHYNFLNDEIDLDSLHRLFPDVEFKNYHLRKSAKQGQKENLHQQNSQGQQRSSAYLFGVLLFASLFGLIYAKASRGGE